MRSVCTSYSELVEEALHAVYSTAGESGYCTLTANSSASVAAGAGAMIVEPAAAVGTPMIGPQPQPQVQPQPNTSYAVLTAKRYMREPYSEVAPPLLSTLAVLILHANLTSLRERTTSLTNTTATNSDADSGTFVEISSCMYSHLNYYSRVFCTVQ